MKTTLISTALLGALALLSNAPALGGTTLYETLEIGSGEQIPYAVHLPDGFDVVVDLRAVPAG